MSEVEELKKQTEILQRIEADLARDKEQAKPIGAPGAGPALDTRKDYERWPRKVKLYKGEIPFHDGKEQTRFPVTEKCDITGKDGKPCGQRLIAQKVTNWKFVKDTYGHGGQQEYDPNDTRIYLQCSVHGPHPAGPMRWDEHGNPL